MTDHAWHCTEGDDCRCDAAEQLAEHLAGYQWYSNPDFPLLHESSAHREHRYDSDCAICRGDLPRIAAVALAYVQAAPTGEELAEALEVLSDPRAGQIIDAAFFADAQAAPNEEADHG